MNYSCLHLSFGGIFDKIVWVAIDSDERWYWTPRTPGILTLRKVPFPGLLMFNKDCLSSCYQCVNLTIEKVSIVYMSIGMVRTKDMALSRILVEEKAVFVQS